MNQILSTSLCEGIASWFNNNIYFTQLFNPTNKLFKKIDSYYRIDFLQGDMTSLSIYPINNNDTVTKPTKEIGKIGIDVVFSSGLERDKRSQIVNYTMSTIRAQLLSNPVSIQSYLNKNYVPGLQFINTQNTIDYNKFNKQIYSKSGSTTCLIMLNYQIDILLNQRALWKTGNDFYSPITKIYNTINSINISTTFNKIYNMEGYYVTPSNGYNTTGTLIIPESYMGKGLLLGNNGTIIQSLQNQNKTTKLNPKYYYVDIINSVYLSTGMLILSDNSISGNSGLLLGDDGIIYQIIYDGAQFSPIFYSLNSVYKNNIYQTDGLLLTRIDANVGNSGILFGSDNNIYYTIYTTN